MFRVQGRGFIGFRVGGFGVLGFRVAPGNPGPETLGDVQLHQRAVPGPQKYVK